MQPRKKASRSGSASNVTLNSTPGGLQLLFEAREDRVGCGDMEYDLRGEKPKVRMF